MSGCGAVREILPGVFHWTALHPKLGSDVSCYWLARERVALNPLEPPGGAAALPGGPAACSVLTSRHHLRDSERFGAPILAPEPGLHEFADGPEVAGYADGEELPGGLLARQGDPWLGDAHAALERFVARG